ncbi:BON domain-containing protein [Martelella mangrovi]|uniref:BON domain-containing protein n=1 Tax=Martelella mangrovi TaxID=1397477 RepID=A0ABV2IAW8_9HYPH|nr:BON domain-containing protein [uncultured Martelella sp.]
MVQKKAAFFGTTVENTEDWQESARKEDAIATELAASGLVDATEVQVAVSGDEARLTGTVYLREEIATAGNIALGVEGINRVRNGLKPRERSIQTRNQSHDKEADARAQTRTL